MLRLDPNHRLNIRCHKDFRQTVGVPAIDFRITSPSPAFAPLANKNS